VTTAEWVEFMNAAFDRPANDRIPHVWTPFVWGAQGTTPNTPGGLRWTVPAGNAMRGVGGLDWRTSAIYCNWLHNGKGLDRAAFMDGAYDVSTFGYSGGGSLFSDQLTRSPGARYWVPSLDEWMKAAFYDPDRNGDGQGGWWTYSNGSDQPFVYGPPGVLVNGQPATANAGWSGDTHPGFSPYATLLGSYAETSAYGLYDLAGGASEWTEHTFWIQGESLPRDRIFKGSAWNLAVGPPQDQARGGGGSAFPSFAGSDTGFRVAAAVPAPGGIALLVGWFVAVSGRRNDPARRPRPNPHTVNNRFSRRIPLAFALRWRTLWVARSLERPPHAPGPSASCIHLPLCPSAHLPICGRPGR